MYYILRETITQHSHLAECIESSASLETAYYRLDELSALYNPEGATHYSVWQASLGNVFERHIWTIFAGGTPDWALIQHRSLGIDMAAHGAIDAYRSKVSK